MSPEPTTSDRREEGQPGSEGAESFVFLDRPGKRWPRFKRYSLLLGGLAALGMVIFIQP